MKWWYEPQNEKYFHYCNCYEECLDEIVSICRFNIRNHNVPNYYIYNDNGLYDLVKGSEIDPLSICRLSETYKNPDISLSEVKDTFEEEYDRLKAIVYREYERTPEQLNEIAEKINIMQGDSLRMDILQLNNKMLVKEYSVKYGVGNILCPYVIKSFEYDYIESARDLNAITDMMIEEYDIENLTEEHSYVIAINGNKLIGIYQLSKGTDSSCEMNTRMIFKFLLLVGANSFFVMHNHPNQDKAEMSYDDYNVTRRIEEAAKFMGMQFLEHAIIGRGCYSFIKKEVIKDEDIYFN